MHIQWRNYKSEKGSAQGYVSGVHFQKCSKFSLIFFTLHVNISTQKFYRLQTESQA